MNPAKRTALRAAIVLATMGVLVIAVLFFPWNLLRGPIASYFGHQLGRPVAIVAAAGVAIAAGLHLPLRVGWRELVVVGCTATIGLVFALFFATAVMPLGPLLLG